MEGDDATLRLLFDGIEGARISQKGFLKAYEDINDAGRVFEIPIRQGKVI
jgi:hypothetical protein